MSDVRKAMADLRVAIANEKKDADTCWWREHDRVVSLEKALHSILLQCENRADSSALTALANLARDAILASNPDATISRQDSIPGCTKIIRLRDGFILGGHGGPTGGGNE